MEILAPVGKWENLIAAVKAGCDAVYLGGDVFSARAYAGNFSKEELVKAVSYAHMYQVKVYLTLNTLLKDSEILEALEYARWAWNQGVDAIIIQDPGLAYLLTNTYPEIELHASTQMDIHNVSSLEGIKEKGFSRVILARELSLEEIENLSRRGIDVEVFVQGALCISASGMCLASSFIGGRSGNRGRCAQTCRLYYKRFAKDRFVEEGHLLSPKDMILVDELQGLKNAGVKSIKIEGRMRSPSYVYEAVKLYRDALDGKEVDRKPLTEIFNREGFSTGYLKKNWPSKLMAKNYPGNTGVEIGRKVKDRIVLTDTLQKGDGIRVGGEGGIVEKILHRDKEVLWANKGDQVTILPRFKGDGKVFKTFDKELENKAKKVLQDPYGKKVKVSAKVIFEPGEPFTIHLGDKTFQGKEVEVAKNAPLTPERISENLKKQGDHPFILEPEFTVYKPGFLPMKALNQVRREALESLLEEEGRKEIEKRGLPVKVRKSFPFSKMAVIRDKRYLSLIPKDIDLVIDPFFKDPGTIHFKDLKEIDRDFLIRFPAVFPDPIEPFVNQVIGIKNVKGILTSNPGVIELIKEKIPVIGDYKLNLLNSYGLSFYPKLSGALISEEMSMEELRAVENKDAYSIYVYGPLENMITKHCQDRQGEPCKEPCRKQNSSLIDRKGKVIPIGHNIFCYNHLYNPMKKNILEKVQEFKDLGYCSFLIELFHESPQDAKMILEAFASEKVYRGREETFGHLYRGVL